jgi:hypothetical protein
MHLTFTSNESGVVVDDDALRDFIDDKLKDLKPGSPVEFADLLFAIDDATINGGKHSNIVNVGLDVSHENEWYRIVKNAVVNVLLDHPGYTNIDPTPTKRFWKL